MSKSMSHGFNFSKLCVCVCVGLQYVWEYRSPSKSVPPHYQCRLCKVTKLQSDMIRHIRGWKHSFKYLVSVCSFSSLAQCFAIANLMP